MRFPSVRGVLGTHGLAQIAPFVPKSPNLTEPTVSEAKELPLPHIHETWWLIESAVTPRPLYYAGPKRGKKTHHVETTEDANEAVRFPTEAVAKLTIANMVGADTSQPMWPLTVGTSAWKAAEHIFDYTPRAIQDAKRYRWLRDGKNLAAVRLIESLEGRKLDEAIDTAMTRGER
jgi:hypothetical protein